MADYNEAHELLAQIAATNAQMNKNQKKTERLEAENAKLLVRVK
ncbi:hypothetical protein PanWU01x14_227290 [Parasponia andersonii]|uniref:Uncharacterized protein n=1 Tax=Parasponia andersonii TaxID=3476 RepID=A0A2P5BM47_PARAD|nr:hypothetical protein PanWU01x14_227290 [Parasponia andersonii]